jgi:cobalt-zinc-cadmium resistance protein CzcA
MVTTTILTLLVLPVVFTWAHRHRRPPPRDSDVNPTAAMLP